eukprot:CAMPEP_0197078568 /NCGR_PEP_ID=MMETSP1384-20130603/213181_1 /TAXON_ID=29189 /ORGANISM="Ammonia sp." /LENGTH=450 /DNA_ID=CAMNT_0042517435 /DNA_START=356 /DNA_END=1708 /DNA_ORIENTATION=+
MFAGPRKSITALFSSAEEPEFIGKEISRPTKSFATRAWAANQSQLERKMLPQHLKESSEHKQQQQSTDDLQTELRHLHMSLLAERARVQELEGQLKQLTEEKYTNHSNIIDQLRSSQDTLREQLQRVIQSKMDLCESTSLEIERLRIIIAELTNHLSKDDASPINIEKILSKYNKQIASIKAASSSLHIDEEQKYEHNLAADAGGIAKHGMYPPDDLRPLEEQLNNPRDIDANLPRYLQPFPHRDISRIDIRTVSPGDGITYPDPFAAVDLKYTGYKFIRDSNQWTKFTSTNISSTVFETRLGNHENIIGLEQAVLSMTKGEVARVWVPSRLGYGVHGAEPLIPPNTDLVFELTLVEIRNDFAMAANDENDPLDPDQLAQIQQEHDDPQYATGQLSQLTANNLNQLNSMNQPDPYSQEYAQNDRYNAQENDLLGFGDDDNYAQQNSFQVL